MDHLLQDLRQALRHLGRDKGLAAVAMLTLALGIGANTAIYSLINTVLLRPLPYPDSERLVMIWRPDEAGSTTWIAVPEGESYSREAKTFETIGQYTSVNVNLTGGREPERINAAATTAGVFQALQVPALLGRPIMPADDTPGANTSVLLGYGVWQRRLGGDERIVGQTIQVNGRARTVIGVMPESFRLPLDYREERPTELWVPLGADLARANWGDHSYIAFGRLKPGVRPELATAELDAIRDSWNRGGVTNEQGTNSLHREAIPLQRFLTGGIRNTLLILLGAVGFVLLIACVNVANLLLAKADARRREIAVRSALGATRRRVIRQLLTESTVLAAGGGVLGMLVAFWSMRLLILLHPAGLPRIEEIGMNLGVLGFSAGLALVTGILFGLAPALQLSRPDLTGVLKEGGQGGTVGRARQRFRRGLVVLEMASSVVLVVGAGLLIRSFIQLSRINLGFDDGNLLTMRVTLPTATYPDSAGVVSFFRRAVDGIEQLPGVRSAAAVRALPLTGTIGDWSIAIEGRPTQPNENPNGDWQVVTDGYFETMGIRLLRGRFLTPADREDGALSVVINQTMAQKYWPDQDPIGQRFHLGTLNQPWITIVGIVDQVRHNAVLETPRQEMYLPHAQFPAQTGFAPRGMTLVIKTVSDPRSMIGAARQVIRTLDPDLPVAEIRTMRQVTADALSQPRFTALLLGVFAAVALTLAAIGIYGTISLLVTQRSHEIGIRMALGAERRSIVRMVLGQGMELAAAGVGLGLAGAFFLTRLLERLMYGVSRLDPVTFVMVPLLLGVVALVACFTPARRAARLDPVMTLRRE